MEIEDAMLGEARAYADAFVTEHLDTIDAIEGSVPRLMYAIVRDLVAVAWLDGRKHELRLMAQVKP